MSVEAFLTLLAAFACIATLYSSVGHAGASGYLAIMALISIAPETMRPTALALNILAASLTVYRFSRAGYFSWRGLWPFLAGSIPLAAVGGAWQLGNRSYYMLVGVALLLSAGVLVWRAYSRDGTQERGEVRVPVGPAVLIGAVIGLLSGLTGTGGGIFLSPMLLLLGWAGPRQTAGISAPFILLNSATALSSGSATWASLPAELPWLGAAVLGGAFIGTWLGLKRLSSSALFIALAIVLVLAALKLFLTG